MNKHFKLLLCVTLPMFAVLLTADLVSKFLIDGSLGLGQSANFLPGLINIVNVHNNGAAWGMFSGAQTFLIVLSFIFIIALIWLMLAEKTTNPLFHIALGFVFAGCLGNLVDRLAFGYVRDFLHFEFWSSFPVFNIADVCLTLGVVLFIIYFIIIIVKNKKKKKEEKLEEKD